MSSDNRYIFPRDITKTILDFAQKDPEVTENPVRCWTLILCLDKSKFWEGKQVPEEVLRKIYALALKSVTSLKKYKGYVKSGIITAYLTFRHLSNPAQYAIINAYARDLNLSHFYFDISKPYIMPHKNNTILGNDFKRINLSNGYVDKFSDNVYARLTERKAYKIRYEKPWLDSTFQVHEGIDYDDTIKIFWGMYTRDINFSDLCAHYVELFFSDEIFNNTFFLRHRENDKVTCYALFYKQLLEQTTSQLLCAKKEALKRINGLLSISDMPPLIDEKEITMPPESMMCKKKKKRKCVIQ